jgi:NAD(P)-dependent dehydrogenase (short-subunit alcohol dehydrogenase family)
MTDRLKGKLAFCTASAAGIGRATAIAFAREGRARHRQRHQQGGHGRLD